MGVAALRQTAARPCKRKQRAASCPSQLLQSTTPAGEAAGSAAPQLSAITLSRQCLPQPH
jgi:hypothetical protein